MKKITFLSNHDDLTPLQKFFPDAEIVLIRHPYVEPHWTTDELAARCSETINAAINAAELVINGDYTLVSLVVLNRWKADKRTGFLCMKREEARSERGPDGRIRNQNVLTPCGVRWIDPDI